MSNKKLKLAIAMLFSVLIIDLIVPFGTAIGVVYMLCLVLLIRESPKEIIIASVLAIVLLVIVPLTTTNDNTSWIAYVNRGISIVTILVFCGISVKYKKIDMAAEAYTMQLNQIYNEHEQLTYIASHDLQEPLRTVSNYANLLEEKYHSQLDATAKKCLDYMRVANDRMSNLLLGYLKYSNLGKNLTLDKVDCNMILSEIMLDLKDEINASKAKIEYSNLPTIVAYRAGVILLISNLLSNAIKFSKDKTTPIIGIRAVKENGFWKFSIRDNGIGIEPEYQKKIFHLFQQLKEDDNRKGSGVGLALCQKIVALHKGTIWVHSVTGVGSTFYFTIPI